MLPLMSKTYIECICRFPYLLSLKRFLGTRRHHQNILNMHSIERLMLDLSGLFKSQQCNCAQQKKLIINDCSPSRHVSALGTARQWSTHFLKLSSSTMSNTKKVATEVADIKAYWEFETIQLHDFQ